MLCDRIHASVSQTKINLYSPQWFFESLWALTVNNNNLGSWYNIDSMNGVHTVAMSFDKTMLHNPQPKCFDALSERGCSSCAHRISCWTAPWPALEASLSRPCGWCLRRLWDEEHSLVAPYTPHSDGLTLTAWCRYTKSRTTLVLIQSLPLMEPKAFLSKVTRLGAVKEIQMKVCSYQRVKFYGGL